MQKLARELTNLAPPPPLEDFGSDYQQGVWTVEMAGAGHYVIRAIYKSSRTAMADKRNNVMYAFSGAIVDALKFAITIARCSK